MYPPNSVTAASRAIPCEESELMGRVATLLSLIARPGLAAGNDRVAAYERAFAQTLLGDGTTEALAFWRGRVALWTLLKALDLQPGDEVVVPAYTCEMVPAAVRFAGAVLRYADVAEGSPNVSPQTIAAAMTPRTRAVLCQHTYGCELPMAEIGAVAGGAVMLEDRCQLICDASLPVTSPGSAAFYSTQWSKPFSTGLGGMATFEDASLAQRCRLIRDGFRAAGQGRRARSLAVQLLAYSLVVRPWTRHAIAAAYRRAQGWGLVRGTTSAAEYDERMPDDYLAPGLNIQACLGLPQMKRWGENLQHRRRLSEIYISELGGWTVHPHSSGRPLWAVPVWVENKIEVLEAARRARLPVATWFGRLPVHVAPPSSARYGYAVSHCPRAEQLFEREIHLPTGLDVSVEQARGAAALVKRVARFTSL